MAREQFIERKFTANTLKLIATANEIVAEYQEQGFTLTLRQLYYQFVARDVLPNKQSEYKRLGSIVNDARLAGLLDWEAIEDRERTVRSSPAWTSPQEIMRAVAEQYQENPWLHQASRPEVWIEKSALLGVIEPVCRRMRVPFFACRGYASQSAIYAAGKRFAQIRRQGFRPVVLHLGDHDPSGIDMTRDNQGRLGLFARRGVTVKRLALNWSQVEQYDPPPNPAKDTDSRAGAELEDGSFTPGSYRDLYGESCWELDALEPTVIDNLIQAALDDLIDREAWDADMAAEAEHRAGLDQAARRWDEVAEFLQGDDE